MNDIVVDTNVMALLGKGGGKAYCDLFEWLINRGCLSVSKKILVEYGGEANPFLATLLNVLVASNRINTICQKEVKRFAVSSTYCFTCNEKDKYIVAITMLSCRKLIISKDKRLIADVNGHPKVSGVKGCAMSSGYQCHLI